MSTTPANGWSQQDSEAVIRATDEKLRDALSSDVPPGLTTEEAARLRRTLLDALPREAAQGARRLCHVFATDRERLREAEAKQRTRLAREASAVERLSLHLRVQHMILFSSCILLIITGLPIKFHESAVSGAVMSLFGGPSVTGFLHRAGAVGLTLIGLYHIFYSVAFRSGRRDFGLLIPKLQDAKDALRQILYFIGRRKERPLYGRFSYIEKFDYWAVYWGMVVMISSGFILWFKEAAINGFGKSIYDIAREAHSDEALLATLAIVIWHFYNVHFNPKRFPGSLTWWNGKITVDEFKEEHPLEYEEWRLSGKVAGEQEAAGEAPPGDNA